MSWEGKQLATQLSAESSVVSTLVVLGQDHVSSLQVDVSASSRVVQDLAPMTSHPAFSCPGHGQPCETRSVTKAGSPHVGRPFYVCTASPQCKGWFQFADEPVRQPGMPLASDPACQTVPSGLPGIT